MIVPLYLDAPAGIELLGVQPLPVPLRMETRHVLPVLLQTAQVVWNTRTGQGADTVLQEPNGDKVLLDNVKLLINSFIIIISLSLLFQRCDFISAADHFRP